MPRLQSPPQVQEAAAPAPAALAAPETTEPQVIPILAPRKKKAMPKLRNPAPRRATRKGSPTIEELILPLPPTPSQQRQHCLALMMQTAGHSLDLGCRLCFTNCVYGGPCGCGGWNCVDRRNGELVVFTETAKLSRRQRKREAKAARRLQAGKGPGVLGRLFRPWTWFSRKASQATEAGPGTP